MKKIKTSKGDFYFENETIYIGSKVIDKDVAFENLKVVIRIMKKYDIKILPALGTLLGIIRGGDFIDWDEDIDLHVNEEDIEKFKNSLWDLKDEGFTLFRTDRCDHLFSIRRNGEYIDFYIMRKISEEIRTAMGPDFFLSRHLDDLIDYPFRGITIQVPRDYEEYLYLAYGDWRTPVQYANFNRSKVSIAVSRFRNWIKQQFPYKVRWWMLRTYHKKHLKRFLAKCEKRGFEIKEKIDY